MGSGTKGGPQVPRGREEVAEAQTARQSPQGTKGGVHRVTLGLILECSVEGGAFKAGWLVRNGWQMGWTEVGK